MKFIYITSYINPGPNPATWMLWGFRTTHSSTRRPASVKTPLPPSKCTDTACRRETSCTACRRADSGAPTTSDSSNLGRLGFGRGNRGVRDSHQVDSPRSCLPGHQVRLRSDPQPQTEVRPGKYPTWSGSHEVTSPLLVPRILQAAPSISRYVLGGLCPLNLRRWGVRSSGVRRAFTPLGGIWEVAHSNPGSIRYLHRK